MQCVIKAQYLKYVKRFFFFFFPEKVFLHTEGMGLSPSRLLPSAWLQGHGSAPLFPLAHMCVPALYLVNFRAHLSLETSSSRSLRTKPLGSLLDHVPRVLGVLGDMPALAAVPWCAYVLGHLVALVEAHSHGAAQSHGCCCSMAATAEGQIFF